MAPHSSISPGESQGRGSLVGCRLWGRTELDTTEVTQQQQKSYWALRTFKWLEMGIFPASWHLVLVKILDICNFNTVFSFVSVWWLFAGCCVWLLAIHGLQHATLHCLSLSPRVCSNSCPLNQWCHPTISSSVAHFLLPSIFPSIMVFFPSASALRIRWPKFGASASASVLPVISFRIDCFDLLAVQGTLKSLLQHHSLKASILWYSAFFMVQLSHPCMTTRKTIASTRRTFVGKVMSMLFRMLSSFVIAFLPRSKCLLISWLHLPSAVILEPRKRKSVTASTFPHLFAMKWRDHMLWS